MEYRHGTCASCGAHYRVPATFKADKAKCKKCQGVVEIGPVQSDESAGSAAGKPAPAKAAPARKPAPRSDRSAPASGGRSGGGAAAKAAPKAGTPKAGGRAKEPDSVRAAAEAAADRVRSAGTRKGGKKAGVQRKRTGAGRSSSRKPRRGAAAKKKNPAVLIGGLVVLVLMAFGGFFLLKGGEGSETQAAGPDTASVDPTPAGEAVELAEPEEAAPEAAPEEEPEVEVEKAPPPPPDPDQIDLTLLAELGKLPETSDDDWQQYQEWVAVFIDPDSGAAGNRARKKLLEAGRVAFPAILNPFKTVNFATDEGYRTGDLIQRLLKDICRGQNFDWRYTTEPKDVLFNKKVVRVWYGSWEQVVENPRAWVKLGKLTDDEAAEYMAQFEEAGDIGAGDELDDF